MINTVSDVLKSHNLKLLFFVFFNLGSNENNEYFEFRLKYRASKFATIEITDKLLNENNNLISKYTGLIFSVSNKEHISKIFEIFFMFRIRCGASSITLETPHLLCVCP